MNSSIEVGESDAVPIAHHYQIELFSPISHHEEVLECNDDMDQ